MKKLTFNDLNSPETMRNPIMFYKNLMEQKERFFHIDDFLWNGRGMGCIFTMMMWLLF